MKHDYNYALLVRKICFVATEWKYTDMQSLKKHYSAYPEYLAVIDEKPLCIKQVLDENLREKKDSQGKH